MPVSHNSDHLISSNLVLMFSKLFFTMSVSASPFEGTALRQPGTAVPGQCRSAGAGAGQCRVRDREGRAEGAEPALSAATRRTAPAAIAQRERAARKTAEGVIGWAFPERERKYLGNVNSHTSSSCRNPREGKSFTLQNTTNPREPKIQREITVGDGQELGPLLLVSTLNVKTFPG